MMKPLRFILASQLKRSPLARKTGGFTLIELLVAIILAVLVIAPLLGFMIDILSSDRKEQAKATTEQEIKSALDYISQDLEQAVYIYDADGLNNSSTGAAPAIGIKDQLPACPSNTTCEPVLVFWKRYFLPYTAKALYRNYTATAQNDTVGCIVKLNSSKCNNQDYLLYSLVAYYYIQDNSSANSTWSKTARIARFEIRDGIRSSQNTGLDGSRDEVDPVTGATTKVEYDLMPSWGFMPFSVAVSGDLPTKMNKWQKNAEDYKNPQFDILVDYIDQTPENKMNNANAKLPADCGINKPVGATTVKVVPSGPKNGSFYACVDIYKTTAQVTLRGNALARINNPSSSIYTDSSPSVYFPTASIQVKGRGFLYTK